MFLKKLKGILLSLPLIFMLGGIPTTVEAQEDGLNYTIAVEPVENQIDKTATYYDLLVTPGQKQQLTVIVTNTGTKNKKIRVTPTNAVTNQNGVIDYSRQEKDYQYDQTLRHPFTSLVGPEQTVEVAPKETKKVVFELNVPKEPFEGMILGGFLADLPDEKSDKEEAKGVKIVNKFQLVKAVRLRENEEKIAPELVLNDVKPTLVAYRTAVTANLQNIKPTMFGEMKIDTVITQKGKKEVVNKKTNMSMEMAPNSNFDYAIMWDNQRLVPGDYTLNLVAKSGEREWKFTKDFTISKEVSKKLNEEAVGLEEPEHPYWLYLAIALAVILILLLIFIVIWKKRNDKKKKGKKTLKGGKSKKRKRKK